MPPQPMVMQYRPWLHRYAILVVVVTFLLVVVGGNVTSNEWGMAIKDWPTSFGYNMFLAPLRLWTGAGNEDKFWEHSHRLKGILVGLLIIGLSLWLLLTQYKRPWMVWFGLAVLGVVIAQGVLGGLRVTEISYKFAFFHGVLGQLFLCMTVLVAAATGRLWLDRATERQTETAVARSLALLRYLSLALVAALVVQLMVGAAMRHTKAALAIPDFPLSYGRLIPPLTEGAIGAAGLPYGVQQVMFAFAHRAWAVVVVGMAIWLGVAVWRGRARLAMARGPAAAVLILLSIQVLLGAAIIWTQRRPDLATAHQAVGAAVLAIATLLAIRVHLAPKSREITSRGVEALSA